MPRIYVETSVISYLTGRPSRDLIVAARQEATREWWESRSDKFAAFSSQLVLKEVAAGDPVAAMRRLAICQPLPLLPINAKCEALAERLVSGDPEMTFASDMTQTPVSATDNTARLGCNDPLLQELWAIKARMNAESGYSIQKLAEQARQFNLEETLTHLRKLVN